MTIGKTIALTRQTFVGKVMCLLFNMLSRLVIAFLSRSKCLLMTAVTICSDFGAQKYGKDQFSFQSQRKAMPKNVQTTAQLHSSNTLAT